MLLFSTFVVEAVMVIYNPPPLFVLGVCQLSTRCKRVRLSIYWFVWLLVREGGGGEATREIEHVLYLVVVV